LYSKVTEAHEQLGAVSRQLMEAQENERREVARELHDEIGQVLTAVRTNLQVLRITNNDPTMNTHLDDSMTIVDHAIDEIRSLSLNLRPSILDEFGLVAALEWYLDRQAERTGLKIELQVDSEKFRAPAALETTCFRVVQSALTNIVRHAKATRVQVIIRQYPAEESESAPGYQIEVTIRDNGVGFDVASALERARRGESMGLLGMLERARLAGGRFEIDSTPGQGTEIHLWVPSP
jgi:signal transduction histidine kinase